MADTKNCLHCTLNAVIDQWLAEHAERDNGKVVVHIGDILQALAEVAGEYCELAPERSDRRRMLRFFHEALDAAVKAVRTGKPVPVDVTSVH